ncbi:glycosyltransferase [Saccharolobus islandicus]|uniref:glycosyltransferase n=1 Tax=Saccharolobus islandicus TaxID=43080 RepID=UPI000363AE78
MVKLSIIVVNVKGKENLPRLISSLNRSTYKDFELIVVDDSNSISGNLKLVNITKDLGLAYCRNKGVEASSGKFLLFLDNDTELTEDTLEKFIGFIEKNTDSIAQLKLIRDDGRIDAAGGVIDELGYPFELFKGEDVKEIDEIDHNILYAKGAAIGMSREIFSELNGFDNEYFYGYDETDLCYRAIKKGKRIVYLSSATVFHHEHGSFSKFTKEREKRLVYYLESRRLYFIFKNFDSSFLIPRIHKIFFYFLGSILIDIIYRKKSHMALARIRALIWFISRIHKIIIFRINNRKSFLFNENYLMTKGLIIKHKDLIKKVSTLSNVKNFP